MDTPEDEIKHMEEQAKKLGYAFFYLTIEPGFDPAKMGWNFNVDMLRATYNDPGAVLRYYGVIEPDDNNIGKPMVVFVLMPGHYQ